MSFVQTVVLGAIAGLTIYLGLPISRIKGIPDKLRSFLAMSSAGILIFLFFDIFSQLSSPIEETLTGKNYAQFALLLGVFIAGFGGGLLALITFEHRLMHASAGSLSPARLALLIAAGIGLHNFSE